MSGGFFDDDENKDKMFHVKKKIGFNYRERIRKALKKAETVDDYRDLIMNFDSSIVQRNFLGALCYYERMPKKAIIEFPARIRTVYGVEIEIEPPESVEVEFDYLRSREWHDNFYTYAPVEIRRAVHRLGDPISELAFLSEV